MVEAKILNLAITDKGFVIILKPENNDKVIPISIATLEAQSIMTNLIEYKQERPLTHDLIKNIFTACDIRLINIIIDNIHIDTYFAKLLIEHNKKNIFIDARPSDAMALALRFKCPIFIEEHVIDKAGILLENGDELSSVPFVYQRFDTQEDAFIEKNTAATKKEENISANNRTKEEIKRLFEQAIKEERYEDAAKYRDELDKFN